MEFMELCGICGVHLESMGGFKVHGWWDRDAKHRVEGGPVGPQKKIVTLPKLGLFSGRKAQEACPSILM